MERQLHCYLCESNGTILLCTVMHYVPRWPSCIQGSEYNPGLLADINMGPLVIPPSSYNDRYIDNTATSIDGECLIYYF